MKSVLWICPTLLIALPELSCDRFEQPDTGSIVARVNDTVLTARDMQAEMQTVVLPAATSQMQQEWVQEWIQAELLYQEALRMELDNDPKLSRELQRMQRDYLANILLEQILSEDPPRVTDDEINTYYEEFKEEFIRQEPEFRVSVIVLQTENAAREVWRNLVRGRTDFGEMARTRSLDEISAQKDGDLGFLKRDDFSDSDFKEMVFAMKVGDLSRAVSTESGFYIIQVTDSHEAGSVQDLDEVRSQIVNRVLENRRRDKIKELMDGLRQKAVVEVDRSHLIYQMEDPTATRPETQE